MFDDASYDWLCVYELVGFYSLCMVCRVLGVCLSVLYWVVGLNCFGVVFLVLVCLMCLYRLFCLYGLVMVFTMSLVIVIVLLFSDIILLLFYGA